MKTKNIVIVALLVLLAGMASCKKDHNIPIGTVFNANDIDLNLVGTWGVEKIENYHIDYAGNPIASTMSSQVYENGLQMVFREENTGEIYDNSAYTDSTIVYPFTYSYTNDTLFLDINYGTETRTYSCLIIEKTDNSFIYENEYENNRIEKVYLKRLSNEPSVPSNGYIVSVSADPTHGGTSSAGFAIQPCWNIRIFNPMRGKAIRLFRMINGGFLVHLW